MNDATPTLASIRSDLVRLAADMVLREGMPSPLLEDHNLPASTTQKVQRIMSHVLEQADECVSKWARRLIEIERDIERLSKEAKDDE